MGSKSWVRWLLSLVAIACVAPSPARSQTPTNSPNSTPAISTRAADLLIPARAGVGYSTSGGGYDGFGNFEGFIPLKQTPGKDLLYLVGRLLVDNDANLGGNVLVGYRSYSPNANLIYGGYLGYDSRSTGESVFSQLGVGFEALGEGWDARVNGYIPVGNTRQTVSEQLFDTGIQLSDFRFQDHFLQASGSRQQKLIRNLEVAMAGFDVEAGGRILQFGNGGDLRGYAGLYYLSSGENSAGVRGRLQARPLDFLTLGITVQHDSIFGTNVVGTVALTFPNSRPQGVSPSSVLARMGEMPYRINAIAVDNRQEVKLTSSSFVDTILINPATGQPYYFQHVVLGTSDGNGTFESPFGFVQSALNATRSDGNDIVYVQAGTNPGIPAFTIPDRVQVLSTGPVQLVPATIAGLLYPAYQLPLSGSGVFPAVTGTVTMRNDTVLSGFSITSPGAGVTFNNVSTVEVRDNFIANTRDAGILGNGFAIANLYRNQITSTGNQGIFVQNGGTLTVAESRITNTRGAGVAFTTVPTIEIRDNVIQNTGDAGILGNGVTIASLYRNQIAAARNQGIYLQNVGTANVTDNTVANTIAGTTTIANPITGDITIGPITLPNPGSIIPLPTGQGIVIATSTGAVNIANNTVAGTGTQGIVVLDGGGNTTIMGNSVSNTIGADFPVTLNAGSLPLGTIPVPSGQGIVVARVNGSVDVSSNTISNVRGQGLSVAGVLNGTTSVSNNTIRNTLDQGMIVGATSGTTTIANNQISDVATRNVTIANPLGIGPATLTIATGQGLILLNAINTVNVTGNTIERVAGAFSTSPAPDAGQGIAIANFTGQLNLNVTNNQVRNNFNDGILIGLAGRTTGTTTPVNANITISGNTIANNGGATPIRGDGIAIGVEQDSVLNSLVIENNTIQGNGDEGIDLRAGSQSIPLISPSAARVTATIRNNTISVPTLSGTSGQKGIQVEAYTNTRINVTIENNTVTATNSAFPAIDLLTFSTLIGANPQLSANVRFNTLTGNGTPGFRAQTGLQPGVGIPPAPQTLCVNLNGNNSTNGYALINPTFGATLQQVASGTNTGTVSPTGIITPVSACP